MAKIKIYQGDSFPTYYVRPAILDSGVAIDENWSCSVNVTDDEGVEELAARAVTGKAACPVLDSTFYGENCFLVYLTPVETQTLKLGSEHVFTFQVTNDIIVPPFKLEAQYVLEILEQKIAG